ncbi:hypothetical protein GALMADRAFT_53024 [Galerina marginata CBS 339.88]|uniref:Ketoreductase domain-containing protein n=1 Tax=Galerina marginata (strain CBS 339.88) TaxID=685588 RepID=A0A067TQD3_GALM3|nr:hypothetical protein GALMADRAFT_53024 [Galerina marginata CBS 339.88]
MSPVVLVTGCSTGGIGYALCEEFARHGCKVYATSRNIAKIADFADGKIVKLALDVNSDESIAKALQYIVEKEGTLDVVVNNAGVTTPGPLVEVPINDVKDVFETNVFAILRVCKAVVPIMSKKHSGTIVNIGSIVGEIAAPWSGVYSASKAAVNTVSEVLSMELKPFGISVLHVAPGAIKSNIANNGTNRFALAHDTLYAAFLPYIQKRIASSQGPDSMPTKEFAKKVVANALRKSPPRYMTLGGKASFFSVLKWLPRSFVLFLLWRNFSPRT